MVFFTIYLSPVIVPGNVKYNSGQSIRICVTNLLNFACKLDNFVKYKRKMSNPHCV